MKNPIIYLNLVFCLSFALQAKAQDCQNPITAVQFQAYYTQIATQPNNDAKKNMALAFNPNTCWMSSHIKSVCQLFTDDSYKLDFAKAAYSHCYDRANYYDVYDAFGKFSSAMRLHDFITGNGTVVTNPPPPPPPPPPTGLIFPKWNYPVPNNYLGKKGCPGPVVTNETFMEEAMAVNEQTSDEQKFQAMQFSSESHCMSMAMYMKMASLIKDENVRYKAMMNCYPLLYDQENYPSSLVIFPTINKKTEWNTFCKVYLNPPPPCMTGDADFKKINDDMKLKPFADDKMKIFEPASKDKCFNVEQIRTISKQFPFGAEKSKVFKLAYAKCTNRADYYKLVDELAFSSEKEDLKLFIKNN